MTDYRDGGPWILRWLYHLNRLYAWIKKGYCCPKCWCVSTAHVDGKAHNPKECLRCDDYPDEVVQAMQDMMNGKRGGFYMQYDENGNLIRDEDIDAV